MKSLTNSVTGIRFQRVTAAAFAVTVMLFGQPASVGAGEVAQVGHVLPNPLLSGDRQCDSCDAGCQCMRKHCVASVEEETVEKHHWNVESKDVCIPQIVLPWKKGGSGLTLFRFLQDKSRRNGCTSQSCDGDCRSGACPSGRCPKPRCGKVITVCDLVKEKYEDTKCVCKWEIKECLGPGGGGFACDSGLVEAIDDSLEADSSLEQPVRQTDAAAAEVYVDELAWLMVPELAK